MISLLSVAKDISFHWSLRSRGRAICDRTCMRYLHKRLWFNDSLGSLVVNTE